MEELKNKAKAIIDEYAEFEDYDNEGGTEELLERAMNIISEFVKMV